MQASGFARGVSIPVFVYQSISDSKMTEKTVSLIKVKREPSEKVTEKVTRKRTIRNKNATIKRCFCVISVTMERMKSI